MDSRRVAKVEDLALYTFAREGDRHTFVPSTAFSGLSIGMFGAGCLYMLYLASLFFRHAGVVAADLWIGGIFVLVAAYSATLATLAWRTRRTPLTIESRGRVSYGGRELCAGGTVRAVRIAGARGGDGDECEIALELADGTLVYLPSQYFAVYRPLLHARPFAAKLAEVLGVPVTESR